MLIKVHITFFLGQGLGSNHIDDVWHQKSRGKRQLAHFTMAWQHSYGPALCHVPPGSEWARLSVRGRGGLGAHQDWIWGIQVCRAKPVFLHWWRANRQWAMTWLGWVWGSRLGRGRADGRDIGRRGFADGEGWELPVVTLCLYRMSEAPGRTSLSHQLWSDSLRQTFSLSLCFSCCIVILLFLSLYFQTKYSLIILLFLFNPYK